MDRRKFLKASSSLALLPLLPWSKESKKSFTVGHQPPYWQYPPKDVIWVEHLGQWIPRLHYHLASDIAHTFKQRLINHNIEWSDVLLWNIASDITMWRQLRYGWIAFAEIKPDCLHKVAGGNRVHAISVDATIEYLTPEFSNGKKYPLREHWLQMACIEQRITYLAKQMACSNKLGVSC